MLFRSTITSALTINAPSGSYDDGDQITFLFKQNSTGGYALTWDASYKTDLSSTGTADQYSSVTFIWSAGKAKWMQVGKMTWTS